MEDYALADSEDPRSPLGQVDRLLITRNGRDRTLKYYPLLYRRHGPAALGFTGPSCLDGDEPNARKVEVVDLTQQAGRHHDWDVYRCASAFQARLAWYTLFVEPEGPETPQ
jgi:hypothetical protein